LNVRNFSKAREYFEKLAKFESPAIASSIEQAQENYVTNKDNNYLAEEAAHDNELRVLIDNALKVRAYRYLCFL